MRENERYIGVFDSGIGGLTVMKSILDKLPQENIIYFGDTAHVPYGTRSRAQITDYVIADVNFLRTFALKALVIACNTADSIARTAVEAMLPVPVYGVVEPASRRAAAITRNGKIGVIATNATVGSGAYEAAVAAVNPDLQVLSKACPLLVPLVENGRFHQGDPVISTVLQEYLTPLREAGIDTLVLGCTHYPLLQDLIAALMPGITIISSSEAAADALADGLRAQGLNAAQGGKRAYYVSDNAAGFEAAARIFMGGDLGGAVTLIKPED